MVRQTGLVAVGTVVCALARAVLLAVQRVAFAMAWSKRRPLAHCGHLVDHNAPSYFCFRASAMGLTCTAVAVVQIPFVVAQAETTEEVDGREAALDEPELLPFVFGQLCDLASTSERYLLGTYRHFGHRRLVPLASQTE